MDEDYGQTGAWGEVSAKIGQDSSSRVTAQRLNLWACSPLQGRADVTPTH